jgi:hypothetical protein
MCLDCLQTTYCIEKMIGVITTCFSSQTEGVMCRPEVVPIGDGEEVCILMNKS